MLPRQEAALAARSDPGSRAKPALSVDTRAWLEARVRELLATRREAWAQARQEADALRTELRRAEKRAVELEMRLDRSPFSPTMTVHAAHARHPGVQAVFARHGLPRCPDCAVGADETLAEAAFGEGMELADLLRELDTLLG